MHGKPFLLLLSLLLLSGSAEIPALPTDSVAQGKHAANSFKPWRGRLASAARRTQRLSSVPTATAQKAAPSRPQRSILPVLDHPEIKEEHRELAYSVMVHMPEHCQGILKNFYVRYDNPESRGLGGKSSMILSGSVPDDEFRALFIHEFGHLLDLGCLAGSPAAGETAFLDNRTAMYRDDPSVGFYSTSWLSARIQRSDARPEDFVSGYASWDVFEDFAESFAYYMLHRSVFFERAQENAALAAKFTWFQSHFPALPTLGESRTQWTGTVPWDITKLPYKWTEHIAQAESS